MDSQNRDDRHSGSRNFYVATMPHAYSRGNNPWGDGASYYCSDCGLELVDEEVGYVAAGTEYANGEHSKCPSCGAENWVDRCEDD